jgi:hypothetical protein
VELKVVWNLERGESVGVSEECGLVCRLGQWEGGEMCWRHYGREGRRREQEREDG